MLVGGVLVTRFPRSPALNVSKPSGESFQAPGRDWSSEKKVEDYFVENLRMTPEEAKGVREKPGSDGKVMLRLGKNTTFEGLLNNLEYYGFIRDKDTLRCVLEYSEDNLQVKMIYTGEYEI